MRLVLLALSLVSLLFAFAPARAADPSLEEMAGQMVLLGFTGVQPDDDGVRAVREQIAAGRIGGVMYLRANVESLQSVRAINRALVEARPSLPPFIALDQEGGQIERLTPAVGFAALPSAAAVGRLEVAEARSLYAGLGAELARQGFNLNFGPVVDLNLNPSNPIIARYERAFSADPARVTAFASAFVEGHHEAGVATALKHFPGHGSSTADTHLGFVDVTGVWQRVELEPYRAMIASGHADMVMVAHLYNGDIQEGDAMQLPATLSPDWITGILRGELGFDGVVISDDLEMGAVRSRFDLHDVIVRAVMAGNDILLFSNTAAYDRDLGVTIHQILVDEGRADPAFAQRIAESYTRIVALKRDTAIAPHALH